ncbi:MAG: cytochrome-c oxidase, cbb3-type subunit III [Rhodospirillales bacterium]|nr:cytochrome-c oxidase, cbb3-type subunit III [Rhodospirillales bacterium]
MANIEIDEVSGTPTTGHEWDGIKELDTPMPRWWVWTFYACILFSVIWWVLFPSWPTLSDHWKGVIKTTDRTELVDDLAVRETERARWVEKFSALSVTEIAQDNELLNYAMAGGKVIFADNCAPCHGSQGSGSTNYPVLADDDWLWGGSLEEIETTVRFGIRANHEETRTSEMPVFGADYLTKEQIADVAEYVLSFSKRAEDKAAEERGEEVFATDCASCHGEHGEGGRDFGAPKLNDGIWLYGGERADIVRQITTPHLSVMPTWAARLDDVSIKQVAIYVHSLGGGE